MKKDTFVLLIAFLLSFSANATPPPKKDIGMKRFGVSLAGGGVIPIFKVDTRHCDPAKMGFSASGIFRFEYYASQSVHLQFGCEFMSQACKFNTYYFESGYSKFYDRSFGYTHSLRTYEMYIPILARIGFNPNESNAQVLFYVLAGYAPKFSLGSTTAITQNSTGKGVWGGPTTLDYENHFIGLHNGNVLMGGLGLDKRIGFTEKFISYEIVFRYTLSRFIYRGRIGNPDTNELLIKNCCINFQVGYRF